jgi:TRAP-type C4-dicarboxylate transport system permease small subunit
MESLKATLCRLQDGITRVGFIGGVLALGAIVFSYLYEVAARYFFSSPTTWATDLVSYLLCIAVFLTLPQVTKERGHIAVTILVDGAPARVADFLHSAVCTTGFAACLFTAWIGALENYRQFSRGITTLAIHPIPEWWVSVFITYGMVSSAFYFLRYIHPRHRVQPDAAAAMDKIG